MGVQRLSLSVSSPPCLCHCLLMVINFSFCLHLRPYRSLLVTFLFATQTGAPQAHPSASQSFHFLPRWKPLKLIAPAVCYMPWTVRFLLRPLARSPPLHLCVFATTCTYIKLLLLVTFMSSISIVPTFFPNNLQRQTLKQGYYLFLMKSVNYNYCVMTPQNPNLWSPFWKPLVGNFLIKIELVVSCHFWNSPRYAWPIIWSAINGSFISANGIDIHGGGSLEIKRSLYPEENGSEGMFGVKVH